MIGFLSKPLSLIAVYLFFSAPLLAQSAGAPDTFRRVTPPAADYSGPRITIQIQPGDNFTTPRATLPVAAAPLPGAGGVSAGESAGDVSWFWDAVGPSLPGDPARYWSADATLTASPEAALLGAPRLGELAAMAELYGTDLLMQSVGTSISPAFALAVLAVESGGRSQVVSGAGAQGLMQLIPDTAERFDVSDPFDPSENIRGGIAYLDWLMGAFDRDPVLVLAAYNAGEGAVRRAGGVPDYAETRAYVPKVLAAWQTARTLCRTPPDLVSDGCVFRAMAVE